MAINWEEFTETDWAGFTDTDWAEFSTTGTSSPGGDISGSGSAQASDATTTGEVTVGTPVAAATLSDAQVESVGTTAASGSVVSDTENDGTLYWVVTTTSTPPTPEQIKNGENANGHAAADSGSKAL